MLFSWNTYNNFSMCKWKNSENIPVTSIYLFIGKIYFTDSSSIIIIGVESLLASWLYCVSSAWDGAVIAGDLVLENGLSIPSQTIYEHKIESSWKFVLLLFCFWWSNQVMILQMPRQLSCRGMRKIMTWSDEYPTYNSYPSTLIFFKIWTTSSRSLCEKGPKMMSPEGALSLDW